MREWLAAQAASGYAEYDAASFRLTPEQSFARRRRALHVRGRDGQGVPRDRVRAGDDLRRLHDIGDPTGVAAHVLQTLGPDGAWMIVEPFAHDRLEDNLNPVGRIFYSALHDHLPAGISLSRSRCRPRRSSR